jgi:hypothetical protein
MQTRRRAVLLTTTATLVLLAAVLLQIGSAAAQPTTETIMFHLGVDAQNGVWSLGEFSGSLDGVQEVDCSGNAPVGGPQIPAQVVCRVEPMSTNGRILHNNGTPLTGTVVLNLTLQVTTGTAAAQHFQKVAQQTR